MFNSRNVRNTFKYVGQSNRKWLFYSSIASFSLLLISILVIPWLLSIKKLNLDNTNTYADAFFSFAHYICAHFDPAFCALIGLLVSAVVLFIKGEKKHFYLQMYTFVNSHKKPSNNLFQLKTSVIDGFKNPFTLAWLFLFSLISEIYVTSQGNDILSISRLNMIIAVCSIISMLILIFSMLYYIIRYNNESVFFKEDQCLAILNLSKSNTKRLNKYISLCLPSIPEKYNTVDNDINLLKLLLSNVEFSDNLTEQQTIILSYFEKVIIPFVVAMKKTYGTEHVLDMIAKIPGALNHSPYFNTTFYFFLMAVARQHLVQHDKTQDDSIKSQCQQIEIWLSHAQDVFFKAHENYNYEKLCSDSTCPKYFRLYKHYIYHLHSNNIIDIQSYNLRADNYIKKRSIVKVTGWHNSNNKLKLCYSVFDLVFINYSQSNPKEGEHLNAS